MKLPVRPARIGVFLHRPNSLFRLFVYSFLAEFLVLISYAETPVLRVWTADQQSVLTSSDVIDTNQWYMADRFIGLQAGVETDATVATVSITGLTFTCSIPSSLALSFLESNNETPVYIQWNPVYTSLVYHAAEPLTNWQWRSSSVSLVASNAWIHPLVHAQRTVSPTRLVPNVETEQTVVCNIVIPPGALNGQAVFQVQPFFWDIDSGSLDISVLSNTCSSTSFFIDDTISSFVCTHPDALAGTYSFTSYLKVTSHDERPVHYAPGIQIMYSRTQTGWDIRSRIPSRSLEHVYDNGLRVNTSSPIPVLWDEQQMQDEVYLDIGSKYVPADNDMPGLTQCFLFRAQSTSCDDRLSSQFFLNAEGTNLVEASLTIPDGTTYPMDVEPEEANFEVACLAESELARFTNGIYTVKLYDIDSTLRQTYAIPLAGTPVTEIPQLVTSNAVCSTNSRPYLSWKAPVDSGINATVLQIENINIEDDFPHIWTTYEYDPLPTEYAVEQDLFASWTYDLLFARAAMMNVNGADIRVRFSLVEGWRPVLRDF